MEEPILNAHNKAEYEPAHSADCACIGAHVQNTSEIGEFKILSHDFNEGIWRVRWKVIEI